MSPRVAQMWSRVGGKCANQRAVPQKWAGWGMAPDGAARSGTAGVGMARVVCGLPRVGRRVL